MAQILHALTIDETYVLNEGLLPKMGELWFKHPCSKAACMTGWRFGVGESTVGAIIPDQDPVWGTEAQVKCGCLVKMQLTTIIRATFRASSPMDYYCNRDLDIVEDLGLSVSASPDEINDAIREYEENLDRTDYESDYDADNDWDYWDREYERIGMRPIDPNAPMVLNP